MRSVFRGNAAALGGFAFFFVLHIIGGATEQAWLFAIAVVLIAASAVLFPASAVYLSRARNSREITWTTAVGGVIGAALVAGVLWAANDRAWEWWHVPAAIAIALVVARLAHRERPFELRRGPVSSAPE
jgi:hypothetical protein